MDFIISLAHFCEIHGPTSILCTQVAALACNTCQLNEDGRPEDDLDQSAATKSFWETSPDPGQQKQHNGGAPSSFETPPMSPQEGPGMQNPFFPGVREANPMAQKPSHSRHGSSATANADFEEGCENCTFVVPKELSDQLPYRTPGSPRGEGGGRHGTPVLRTRQSIVVPDSPEDSERSHASETDDDTPHSPDGKNTGGGRQSTMRRLSRQTLSRPQRGINHHQANDADESAVCSPITEDPPRLSINEQPPPQTHKHTLSYISARHPYRSDYYSLLRRSCIRTLSQEKLPSGGRSGPIYFGDAVAGYSVAYIFRLPDPRARGRWRTYALIALGGRDGWRVARAMYPLTKEFEKLANSIANLAESTLERESEVGAYAPRPGTASSSGSAAGVAAPGVAPSGQLGGADAPGVTKASGNSIPASGVTDPAQVPPSSPPSSSATVPNGPAILSIPGATAAAPTSAPIAAPPPPPFAPPTRLTPVSSFLSAKKLDPDGYPRFGREATRPKGLAEIVGREDFFVLLHAEFALLLRKLAGGL